MNTLLRSPWLSTLVASVAMAFGGGQQNQSQPQAQPDGYKFYYLPFAAQTFVPVTPEKLTTQGYDRTAKVGKLADDIVTLIEMRTPKAGFDSNTARLAVIFPNHHKAFVDRSGRVLENGASYQIKPDAWKKLQGLMAQISSRP